MAIHQYAVINLPTISNYVTNMSTQKESPPEVTPFTSITITAAQVVPSVDAVFQDGVAFETITQGQAVCLDVTNLIRLADATVNYRVIGLAANAASVGQPIKVLISDPALALGTTVNAGDILYLGPTAGSITITYADLTVGKYVAVIGVGIGANKVNFKVTRADVPK